jgi:hypothetical protein
MTGDCRDAHAPSAANPVGIDNTPAYRSTGNLEKKSKGRSYRTSL